MCRPVSRRSPTGACESHFHEGDTAELSYDWTKATKVGMPYAERRLHEGSTAELSGTPNDPCAVFMFITIAISCNISSSVDFVPWPHAIVTFDACLKLIFVQNYPGSILDPNSILKAKWNLDSIL